MGRLLVGKGSQKTCLGVKDPGLPVRQAEDMNLIPAANGGRVKARAKKTGCSPSS